MALPYHSISELTSYERNEFSYDSTEEPINSTCLPEICTLLNKCGIELKSRNVYDQEFANAVAAFQEIAGIDTGMGILNTPTLHAIILTAERMDDVIEYEDQSEDKENDEDFDSTDPHYDSFFREDNYKTFRKNKQDIRISFGSGAIVKTLKDVYIRSSSVEVDTSGNPISETYEFVARDVIESDEVSDYDKYLTEKITQDDETSSIKFTYDYKGYNTKTEKEAIKNKKLKKKKTKKKILKDIGTLTTTETYSNTISKKREM